MNRRSVLGVSAIAGFGLAVLLGDAFGQEKSPKIAMFDRGGHYIISVMRSDLPPFAVNDRMQGTAEENKAATQGTITYFGTYSVNEPDRTILVRIDGSSFPNWNGADQKRLFAFTGDELKLTVPPAPTGGGSIEVVWKRAH